MESAASEVISFYATRLPDVVGEAYRPASLEFYADHWLHATRPSCRSMLVSLERFADTLSSPFYSRDPTSRARPLRRIHLSHARQGAY